MIIRNASSCLHELWISLIESVQILVLVQIIEPHSNKPLGVQAEWGKSVLGYLGNEHQAAKGGSNTLRFR